MRKQLGYRGGITKTKQVAIISDIGGNTTALKKAMKYFSEHDITNILNCGNSRMYGSGQELVWDKIMQDERFINIGGAGDRKFESKLPDSRIAVIGGIRFLMRHGSNGEGIEEAEEAYDVIVIGGPDAEAYVENYKERVLIRTAALEKNAMLHIILIKIKQTEISIEFKHIK